jgi:hypothetical protein
MELVGEMKWPENAPVRRQLLRGLTVTMHSLNNKMENYIPVPQCIDNASTATALRKYKVVEQIVEPVGGGIESPEGLGNGALWLGNRITETTYGEFTTCSSRAGITVTARMSLEATAAAMWHAVMLLC